MVMASLEEIRQEYDDGYAKAYKHIPDLCDEIMRLRAEMVAQALRIDLLTHELKEYRADVSKAPSMLDIADQCRLLREAFVIDTKALRARVEAAELALADEKLVTGSYNHTVKGLRAQLATAVAALEEALGDVRQLQTRVDDAPHYLGCMERELAAALTAINTKRDANGKV